MLDNKFAINLMVALMVFGLLQFGFFIWAIIEVINANKKIKNQTISLSDIKRVSASLPLGLGILGVIFLYLIVKPAIKDDPVANKKSNLFCWIPFVIFNVLVVFLGLAFLNLQVKDLSVSQKSNKNTSIQQEQTKLTPNQKQELIKKAKNEGKFVDEHDNFIIDEPCKSSENSGPISNKLVRSNNGDDKVTSYTCINQKEEVLYGISYTDVKEKYSNIEKLSNDDFVKKIKHLYVDENFSNEITDLKTKAVSFKGVRALRVQVSIYSAILIPYEKDDSTTRLYTILLHTGENTGKEEELELLRKFAKSFVKL